MGLTDNFLLEEIILENSRVILRPLKKEDLENLDAVAYEKQIWEMGLSKITGSVELETYINTAREEKSAGQSYPFIIFDKSLQSYAGSTRYMNISIPHKRLEIGSTWVNPKFQGTGLNKACKFELLQFAFEKLQFNRVELKTDVLNQQSRKAILKIGAREEGIFRSHFITSTGRIRDSIYFSIIASEWPAIKNSIFAEYL